MGEVYRARDTRLERTVAIKILPPHLSADAARKQRFEHEAKTISSLNHPHICVLHDIGQQDKIDYLVMECVEGETLAKRLEKGPLPLEQVVKYGAQVADALDKAHRSGVVHRDLKPGNIMLTATGAKLLDFGLAKPAVPLASGATLTATATPTTPVTQEGTIVGTFEYMSPEQVEGKELDGRSDIFSLGAVLYEMVTGRRAFEGKSQLSVASAILEKEPSPISTIRPMTPAALDHALKKCLAKQPEERWQSASDLASELKWVGESGSQIAVVRGPRWNWRSAWPGWAVGVAAGLGLLLGAALWWGGKSAGGTMYFSAVFPFPARNMAIAPNGHTVAVVAYQEAARQNVLWLYELGAREARSLGDTEGANFPFWSPDGNSLGFFADGKLKRLEIAGGPVRVLCDAPSGRGGTWNKEGVILFTPSGELGDGIHRILAGGGTSERVSMPDTNQGENTHRWPQFLPDGKHYLYLAGNVSGGIETDALYVGAVDSKERKYVTKSLANGTYAEPGYLLFYRNETLFAQRFDVKKLELSGDAIPLLADVQYRGIILYAAYAASGNGLLLAQSSSAVSRSRLVWYDRKGKEIGSVGRPDVYSNVALSPDGKSVAVDKADVAMANTDVWVYDLQGESEKRLTFDPGIDALPVWSPDGKEIVFTSSRRQLFGLYIKDTSAGEAEKELVRETEDLYAMDWSRDGKAVLYMNGSDFWTLAMPERKGSLFIKATGLLKNAHFSPSGKWVAYASNESGKWEIYVTSFPEAKAKWQVSNGGGEQPRWRADGKELFFLSGKGKIMSVPVKGGANFDSGAPVELFQADPRELVATSEQLVYDVSQDGQRFLINTQVKQAGSEPMSVVLNWGTGRKK